MSTLLRFRFLVLIVLLYVPQALAQPVSGVDPQNKPRKVRNEPAKAFKEWLQDVEPIIRPEELAAWKKLRSDEEREQFIYIFWNGRDLDPDTEANEYREAYYERVAYVNEHFTSGVPGVKTDRGRIYLKYGKPDEIESHPSGGAYNRESYEGGGSTSTYPFERWWYRHLPGHPDVDIEFVDPTGTGEYRIARNPFEKEALINVPGAGPTTDGISQGERLLAANGYGNPFSSRAKDSQFDWMERIKFLSEAPPAGRDPFGSTTTDRPVVDTDSLTTAIHISYFKQSDDRVIVAFTVQTDNQDLVFRDVGGLQTARVNISGRITSVAGRRIGFFEDAVVTTATPSELLDLKGRKSAYQKAVTLPPGRYRIDLLVRDTETGAASLRREGFNVPTFGKDLVSSSLVLASVLQQVSDIPTSRQFIIGDTKVIPNLTGTYRRGSPVGIYMQVYNAGVDQTTLRPSVDVDYVLLKDGQEVFRQAEDWRGNATAGERLTLARLLDTRNLAPGEFTVEVRVRDRVTGQSLVQSANFTIEK
ncbi:MAG: GWxTD domain-containing protein [Acidobacteriota bacterium]